MPSKWPKFALESCRCTSQLARSGDGSELSFNLSVNGALKANQQLLVQHGSDPLERRQLRDMGPLLKPGHGAVRRASRLGDLLLRNAQLKTALAQMRRNRIDLAEGADAFVFGASLTISLAPLGAILGGLRGGTTYGALSSACH